MRGPSIPTKLNVYSISRKMIFFPLSFSSIRIFTHTVLPLSHHHQKKSVSSCVCVCGGGGWGEGRGVGVCVFVCLCDSPK